VTILLLLQGNQLGLVWLSLNSVGYTHLIGWQTCFENLNSPDHISPGELQNSDAHLALAWKASRDPISWSCLAETFALHKNVSSNVHDMKTWLVILFLSRKNFHPKQIFLLSSSRAHFHETDTQKILLGRLYHLPDILHMTFWLVTYICQAKIVCAQRTFVLASAMKLAHRLFCNSEADLPVLGCVWIRRFLITAPSSASAHCGKQP